jgi:hypothetical protein
MSADPASPGLPAFLVGDRFVVTPRDGALHIMDGLLLCREVLQRKLLDGIRAGGIPRRPLLVPVRLPVTEEEARVVDARSEAIAAAGFVLCGSMPAEIVLREFPVALSEWPLVILGRTLIRVIAAAEADAPEGIIRQLCAGLPDTTPAELGLPSLMNMLDELRAWGDGGRPAGLARELSPDELARLLSETRAGG